MLEKFKKGEFAVHQTLDVDRREVRRLCLVREVSLSERLLAVKFLDTGECVEFVGELKNLSPCESEEAILNFFKGEFARLRSTVRRLELAMCADDEEERVKLYGLQKIKIKKTPQELREELARVNDYVRSLRHQRESFAREMFACNK